MSAPDVVQYQDPKSILVVTKTGKVRQLFVPFTVRCSTPVEGIPENTRLYVDLVLKHKRYLLLYWINQKPYPYYYFRIEHSF